MLITNKKALFVLMLLSIFTMIALPLSQIARYENVIKNGTSYKLSCRIYDPYDPFMGRYVRLEVGEDIPKKDFDAIRGDSHDSYLHYDRFIEISADENGFVKYERLVKDRDEIEKGKDYLNFRIDSKYRSDEDIDAGVPEEISLSLRNLDRYYMNERLAKPAEEQINKVLSANENGKDAGKSVYIEIKVLSTLAVPVQLYIDDVKIEDYLKGRRKRCLTQYRSALHLLPEFIARVLLSQEICLTVGCL